MRTVVEPAPTAGPCGLATTRTYTGSPKLGRSTAWATANWASVTPVSGRAEAKVADVSPMTPPAVTGGVTNVVLGLRLSW